MPDRFRNEPLTDFSRPENAAAMRAAIAAVRAGLGRSYPLVIGGERRTSGQTFASMNPAHRSETVGTFALASPALAAEAIAAAHRSFGQWSRTAPAERADLLFRVARCMRERRHELSAWMIFEVGKSWAEADADTAEAIDFCEYYAREALRYAAPPPLTQLAGESSVLHYIPLGVGVVIPPWNFPLAIMAGMTMAAVVCGNTVVLKPSSDAPAIAYKFFEILEAAGMPPGVVNYLTASGKDTGDTLVEHPQTRFVAFTGSRDVGVRIFGRAAALQPGQIWLKRVIAEMGGKDAIVVAADADLDAAADGIVASAFGFQGQKCSACSRAIIEAAVYEPLAKKIAERAEALVLGDPQEAATRVGPVVNEAAFMKINGYMKALGKATLLAGGTSDPSEGYFIWPTVVGGVEPDSPLAQEEIFGPVLALIRARDFDDALRIANATVYGLTGAVYSRDPEKLERARRDFHVGNLYLNRKCTGALVGVHPFGGFNMSGTNSKAGGYDYLRQFMQAKVVAERLADAISP